MTNNIELQDQELNAVSSLKKDPNDSKAKYILNSFYWRTLSDIVKSGANAGRNQELDLGNKTAFIDFGFVDESLLEEDSPAVKKMEQVLKDSQDQNDAFYYLSAWLRKQYRILFNFNKKDDIRKSIDAQEHEIWLFQEQISNLQKARRNLYEKIMRGVLAKRNVSLSVNLKNAMEKLNKLDKREGLFLESLERKKKISRGVFMSIEEKRIHIQKEQYLENLGRQCEGIMAEVGGGTAEGNLRKIGEKIEDFARDIIARKERLNKYKKELEKITEESLRLSPVEIEMRLTEEVDYLRDLVRLSANRLRVEPMSVVYGRNNIATNRDVTENMERIYEFDPLLYKNSRVSIFGKPSIVVVPGKGNGLYDWKNNALIIPAMPYTSIDVSVTNAVVEYKIDVDEEKSMMHSYNQIKEYAGIKSVWALKEKFTKDYTIWMISEYKGYKIFSRDVRAWFEREIGPSKNEIAIPARYATFSLSQKEYDDLFDEILEKSDTTGKKDADVWFRLGVMYAQEEKWGKAVEAFSKCVRIKPDHKFGLYNQALCCLKNSMKQDASNLFKQYIKINPSSWWAGVARDYLMKMK